MTANTSTDSGQAQEPRLDLRAAGLAGVAKTAKSLVTNAPYIFLVMYGTADIIIFKGLVTFGVKYMQQQFTLTAAMAGIIFGQSLHFVVYLISSAICILYTV